MAKVNRLWCIINDNSRLMQRAAPGCDPPSVNSIRKILMVVLGESLTFFSLNFFLVLGGAGYLEGVIIVEASCAI